MKMTIYALSTGPGVSGIAVIRVSGEETSKVIKLLTGKSIARNQEWQLSESSIKSILLS
jgi:tRNA U34 5-carboxymethylaminomethyl modifying GTPase MnmE/TrmE